MSTLSLLRTIPFFQEIDDKELAYFKAHTHVTHYDKNALLFLQGDPSETFYVVMDGWVKLFRETIDGQESVIGLCTVGDTFGENTLFQESSYPMGAQAVDATAVLEISGAVIRDRIRNNSELALNMLAAFAKYTKQLELQVEHLSIMTAPQRIGCFLIKLCAYQKVGRVSVTLPYDKALVASYLGMQRETFSRSLNKLKNAGVHAEGAVITIDEIADLRDLVCNSCSNPDECTVEQRTSCNNRI